ncbi:MAG: hypothetical protein ACYC3N_07690 [Halothiobacillus sp.]
MSDSAQAILEGVMKAAIDAARQLADAAAAGDAFSQGEIMAYYDMLDVIKEQAELAGLEFEDKMLADFDPDELLPAD